MTAARLAHAVLAGALVLLPGRSSRAQTGAPARDSVVRDSVGRDSLRSPSVASDSARRAAGRYVGPHGLQGVLYGLVLAPAWIPTFVDPPAPGAPNRLGFWRNHASLFLSGGGASTPEAEGWTGSGSFEVLRGRLYGELRLEHFRLNVAQPVSLQYRTVRVGRMGHPNPKLAAGVTLGYRDVLGPRAHDGVEVGFPFIAGGPNGWVKLEAAYVMSLQQSSWNYGVRWQRRLAGGPFFTGLNLDLKSWELRDHGELSHATLGVLFGTMYGCR
jgi:hypothetical protein